MRKMRFAWLFGLAAMWVAGCDKPCENGSQCGSDEMCAASICRALTCEATIFAVNPKSGECVPLSGCFLTDEQMLWTSCSADPCAGLDENSCVGDTRCQPIYVNPNVEPPKQSLFGGSRGEDTPTIACSDGGGPVPVPPPDGQSFAPGVNNGEAPKHKAANRSSCGADLSARAYTGCRAAPQIEKRVACESLNNAQCQTRRDCSTRAQDSNGGGGDVGFPVAKPNVGSTEPAPGQAVDLPAFTGECFSRHPQPVTECSFASGPSCLLSPGCQPVGTRCFCPPGALSCDCDDGKYMACESNDRLRRCRTSDECRPDERCDNDEACIAPRTFASAEGSQPGTTPGTASCVGACVPRGCAGMGETMCNSHPECDGGSYGTVCRPKPYCIGGGDIRESGDEGTGGQCGCDAEFVGCAVQKPIDDLSIDRSLLVRDPEIIDHAAFKLETVLKKLAPAGRVDEFTAALIKQVGSGKTLTNGSQSKQRIGYQTFLNELQPDSAGITQRLSNLLHVTALVNRVDLAKPGDCGEARITYALTRAYTDGNQRMTIIFELKVPDDGMNCRAVAQRWAELSLVHSAADRQSRLIALFDEVLKPETVGQIRTNEFLNRTGREPWELREFHLVAGMPELAPVAQTIDSRFAGNIALLDWVKQNSAALEVDNAVIPAQYLAARSTEDGGRLRLGSTDPLIVTGEKALNKLSCAGCHLTETKSPFVHIGERLGKKVGSTYQPIGRAVIDTFLQDELKTRAANLKRVLAGVNTFAATKQTGLARVH